MALGLGRNGGIAILSDLERLLRDPAINVRDAAALGLAMLVDVQVLPALLRQRLLEEEQRGTDQAEELRLTRLKATIDASIRTLCSQAILVDDVGITPKLMVSRVAD